MKRPLFTLVLTPVAVQLMAADHAALAKRYADSAEHHGRQAIEWKQKAQTVPERFVAIEQKHPQAPGTRGHALTMAERHQQKAQQAMEKQRVHAEAAKKLAATAAE